MDGRQAGLGQFTACRVRWGLHGHSFVDMPGKGVQDSFLRWFQLLTLHCSVAQAKSILNASCSNLPWLMCLCCMCNLDVEHGVPISGDVPGNQTRLPAIMSFGVPPAGRPKPNLVPPPPPSLLGPPLLASGDPPPPQPAAPSASPHGPAPLPGIATVAAALPGKSKAPALTMQGRDSCFGFRGLGLLVPRDSSKSCPGMSYGDYTASLRMKAPAAKQPNVRPNPAKAAGGQTPRQAPGDALNFANLYLLPHGRKNEVLAAFCQTQFNSASLDTLSKLAELQSRKSFMDLTAEILNEPQIKHLGWMILA